MTTASATRTCSIGYCTSPVIARGYCTVHYHRWRRHGDPLIECRRPTPAERFFQRVTGDDPLDCWLWTGALNPSGYGRFTDQRSLMAHRWAYEHLRAEIPTGLELDHLCKVRNCVNPWHLEPVTGRVNKQRTAVAMATHCVHGHEFTPTNTYIKPKRGTRECVTCRTDAKRAA